MGLWLWLQLSFDAFYCWISWTLDRCMPSFVMRFIVMHEWTICFIWHHAQINFSECLLPTERCCTLVHWHAELNSYMNAMLSGDYGLLFCFLAVQHTHVDLSISTFVVLDGGSNLVIKCNVDLRLFSCFGSTVKLINSRNIHYQHMIFIQFRLLTGKKKDL